jgi:hypothetical protein
MDLCRFAYGLVDDMQASGKKKSSWPPSYSMTSL